MDARHSAHGPAGGDIVPRCPAGTRAWRVEAGSFGAGGTGRERSTPAPAPPNPGSSVCVSRPMAPGGKSNARSTPATTLKDDLTFLVQRGEGLADRMDELVRASRPSRDRRPTAGAYLFVRGHPSPAIRGIPGELGRTNVAAAIDPTHVAVCAPVRAHGDGRGTETTQSGRTRPVESPEDGTMNPRISPPAPVAGHDLCARRGPGGAVDHVGPRDCLPSPPSRPPLCSPPPGPPGNRRQRSRFRLARSRLNHQRPNTARKQSRPRRKRRKLSKNHPLSKARRQSARANAPFCWTCANAGKTSRLVRGRWRPANRCLPPRNRKSPPGSRTARPAKEAREPGCRTQAARGHRVARPCEGLRNHEAARCGG